MRHLHHRLLGGILLLLLLLLPSYLHAQTPAAPPRRAARPAPSLPLDGTTQRNIEYAKVEGVSLLLDLYSPPLSATSVQQKFPLIIWVHGGAWRSGSKDQCPALPFVSLGYAVASINYRLAPQFHFPAQIYDCKAAVRFLRANAQKYHLDPERFGAWGSSAGGHLVALLGTTGNDKTLDGDVGDHLDQSSAVQAVCDWFGPTDLSRRLDDPSAPNPVLKSVVTNFIGGPEDQVAEKIRLANPITFIDKADPPFLIMHGDRDTTVPIEQSKLLDKALRDAGVETTFKVIFRSGHGGSEFGSLENRNLVVRFFEKHLKPVVR